MRLLCPDGEDPEAWNSTFEAAFANYKFAQARPPHELAAQADDGPAEAGGHVGSRYMTMMKKGGRTATSTLSVLDDGMSLDACGNKGTVVIAERARAPARRLAFDIKMACLLLRRANEHLRSRRGDGAREIPAPPHSPRAGAELNRENRSDLSPSVRRRVPYS